MRIRTSTFLAAAACCLALGSTNLAHAQETVVVGGQPPQPAYPPGYVPPGYAPGYAPPGYAPGYTAPIYQQTQGSYVPQSVAFSGPRIIQDWSEGEPVPPGYHPSTRIRKGLVVGGAVLFGVTYLFSAIAAAAITDSNSACSGCGGTSSAAALWVPGVGPFIQLGQSGSATASLFLVLDGLSQVGGLAMFTIGLASPKTVLVRNDLGSNSSGIHLSLAPVVAPGHTGMGLVGTF